MIDYRTDGPIAFAMFNRPDKLNAMTSAFWGDLRDVVAQAERDDARALVVHGAGKAFSVGGDIEGFGEEVGDAARSRAYLEDAFGALRALEESPVPSIAAVHGHALGGGCELTMACDVVVADATAKFGTPEAGVGLIPGPGSGRGPSHLNLHWMKLMVLAGETLDAQEARLAGLVNRVTAEGEHVAAAEAIARRIATRAPLSVRVGKQLLNQRFAADYSHSINAVAFLQQTADFTEGIAAFTERRAPRFEGR